MSGNRVAEGSGGSRGNNDREIGGSRQDQHSTEKAHKHRVSVTTTDRDRRKRCTRRTDRGNGSCRRIAGRDCDGKGGSHLVDGTGLEPTIS